MKKNLEKLVLGTVQFGLDYGINNFNGKPAKKDSLAILDYACQNGIGIFDTAYAYGNAERILGEFSRISGKEFKVITKLKPNSVKNSRRAYESVRANLEESLGRLEREYVDGFLLHTPGCIRDEKIVEALCRLRKEGLAKKIGVSIYEEDDAIYAAGLGCVDYIQIPYNIFDQRLDRTDFFKIAKKNKVEIFARSAFLQGLFFMPEKKIPRGLQKAKKYFKRLDEIIGKYGLSRWEAAFLFSYRNKNIDHVVFGVDNTDQLAQNINLAVGNADIEDCADELKNEFVNIEKSIIFPSLWKK